MLNEKLKIAVFTGSRAEYGHLKPFLREIKNREEQFDLKLIVTAMHVSYAFGETWKEIEQDGFEMAAKIEMLLATDSATAVASAMGLGTIKFSECLSSLAPDILVILGDRFECLSVAQAALILGIPIAHIHGGELTLGVFDDAIRHSITKMSHLHFASTEEYSKRLIQMGEQPKTVFNVGALACDNVINENLLGKDKLTKIFNFDFSKDYILLTYHPETLLEKESHQALVTIFSAIEHFGEMNVVITKSNADPQGVSINQLIDSYSLRNKDRVFSAASLGSLRYLSVLSHAQVVVGNSSSAIIEAPILGIPTVNIGDRQQGRIRTPSIIDCISTEEKIKSSIQIALSREFKKQALEKKHPYGDGKTAKKIANVLHTIDYSYIKKKNFFDIDFQVGERK